MRITHQMLSRTYLKRMDTNLNKLAKSNDKMSSLRNFNKAHENVPDAGRALKLRKLISNNEKYLTSVRDAQGRATAAEDALRTINGLLISAEDLVVEGLNGTMSETDREKIATEIEKYQEQVYQLMNTQFSDKYVFAASGNKDGSAPFSKSATGELMYQGTLVDSIVSDPATGKPSTRQVVGGVQQYVRIPYDKDNYTDIGYGYKMKEDPANPGEYIVDPNTGFKDTYSGVQCFGYGTNKDGVSLNSYNLFGSMVKNLRADNMDALGKDLNAIPDAMEYLLTSITEIGARTVTLDNQAAQLENEYINLVETQNDLESLDLSHEIIMNKQYENSWMVTLQLGSKILPSTIFEFIR